MAQACELPRASDRSSSHAAIASDTSSATFANSAQGPTTSSNNCAITTPCATGNFGNPRHRDLYFSSSSALQRDWRAANPGNTAAPPKHLWKFDPITGVPYDVTSNLHAPITPNSVGNTDVYACAPCLPQPPPVFNSYRQPQPYQSTPRPEFTQPRGLQPPNEAPSLDFHGVASLASTPTQPLPLTENKQQPLQHQSERRTYVSGAVLPSEGGAQQLLVPVRLNGVLINGTLIDSGSSLSMVSASTLAALPVPLLVEAFMSGPPYIVDIGGSPLHVLGYIDAAVVVSDVEVRHPLVVISELGFPLLLASDILNPHRAIIKLGPADEMCFQVDRCHVCVEARVPVALQRDAEAAVTSVSSDTTLPPDAASRVPVSLPPQVVDDSPSFVEQLPY